LDIFYLNKFSLIHSKNNVNNSFSFWDINMFWCSCF